MLIVCHLRAPERVAGVQDEKKEGKKGREWILVMQHNGKRKVGRMNPNPCHRNFAKIGSRAPRFDLATLDAGPCGIQCGGGCNSNTFLEVCGNSP